MRFHRAARLAVLLCVPWFSACIADGRAFSASDVQVATRPLEAAGRFSLENVNGGIHVDTWDQPQVRIEATKRASNRAALERVQVEISGQGERVDVRTRQPKRGFSWFGSAAAVEYHVTLPRDAQVRVESVNGRIEVDGVKGALEAKTVNGAVAITGAAGRVAASTVNGGIRTSYAQPDADALHRFSTTNGRIDVSLPAGTGGGLEASTVNGRIRSDLALAHEHAHPHSLKGRLGDGRGGFELASVNGSISVVRAGGSGGAERD